MLIYNKVTTTFLFIVFIFTIENTSPALAKQEEYIPLETTGVPVRKRESRILTNHREVTILEALRESMRKEGHVVNSYSPELGIITSVKSTDLKNTKELIGKSIIAGIFGNFPKINRNEEIYTTVTTKVLGKNQDKVLVQARFLKVKWGTSGKILNISIINKTSDFKSFYYSLSRQLGIVIEEIK